jgi:hypothetical protein
MVQRYLRSNEKSQILYQISDKVERRREAKKHDETPKQIGKPAKKETSPNIILRRFNSSHHTLSPSCSMTRPS